ncbi:Replication protein A 32 kDa subunit [Channa argus]|uniref:Replication protein A 32 kDa subunit n=1 Tax=Channa argus TaxID=215402 RepID=A0A6G1QZ20_CHAAH|nr:Replication protein A 32 kDa subunit [Channa argus]KAK2921402.1 hypothetical protein Q8A73_000887 [Channa argus]
MHVTLKLNGLVMWNQAGSQSLGRICSHKAAISKKATLQILPCTVSQLLAASQVSSDDFAFCDRELNQVSVLGVIRGFSPFATNIQYSVDDMTGPPLNVKQWIRCEDCTQAFASPGTYVKVTGSLRNFSGQRSLLAINIHCIDDLNEITSHMLEVVQAHMQLFGKIFDVNMNTTVSSLSGSYSGGNLRGTSPNGMTTIQDQIVLGFSYK